MQNSMEVNFLLTAQGYAQNDWTGLHILMNYDIRAHA